MADPKQPTVDVTAKDTETGDEKTFTFRRRDQVQGDVLLEYFADATDPLTSPRALRTLIREGIHPDDWDAYVELVRGKRFMVDTSALAALGNGLVAAFTERPTLPQPTS